MQDMSILAVIIKSIDHEIQIIRGEVITRSHNVVNKTLSCASLQLIIEVISVRRARLPGYPIIERICIGKPVFSGVTFL